MNNRILKLPIFLKPEYETKLIRIGKDNDGGYLICENSIKDSSCLVSFGISDDYSFEEDFRNRNNNKVLAFDPTVTNKFFLKKIIISLIQFKFNLFYNNFFNYLKFKKFFNNKENFFFKKKIGKGGSIFLSYMTIDDIIKLTEKESQIFFKIDIEGSEYRILNDLIKYSNITSGIVIEFHDCDLHIEKIVKFIKDINLTLVHIHTNNSDDYGVNDVPCSLELSFSKNPIFVSKEVSFPHKLDQKNNPNIKDIELFFSNH